MYADARAEGVPAVEERGPLEVITSDSRGAFAMDAMSLVELSDRRFSAAVRAPAGVRTVRARHMSVAKSWNMDSKVAPSA
jgi:hypothetical protein